MEKIPIHDKLNIDMFTGTLCEDIIAQKVTRIGDEHIRLCVYVEMAKDETGVPYPRAGFYVADEDGNDQAYDDLQKAIDAYNGYE